MAKKAEALRPVSSIAEFIKPQEEVQVEDITEEEKTLAAGANQAFWKVLKRHIENEIGVLEQINEQAIANGLPPEEIGKNTIVISLSKGVIKKIFNIVEDAREAAENGRGK